MFFDARLELGRNGLIENPVAFARDGLQHPVDIFEQWDEAQLNQIDLYHATDKTIVEEHQVKVNSFTATLSNGRYDIVFDAVDKNINEYKTEKRNKLKALFQEKIIQPVDALNNTWNGGYESALLINGKAQTLEYLNQIKGDIHDINNEPHILTVDEIKQVAAEISIAYELHFDWYQSKKREIDNSNDVLVLAEVQL